MSWFAGKDLTKTFLAEDKDKATATRSTNELRLFFEDDGSILWITFIGERLCWGRVNGEAERHADGHGVWRPIRDGWRWTDLNGEPLTKDGLAGTLTKLVAYRGTSRNVDVSEYALRRINGETIPEVERALSASKEMKASALGLLKFLGPRDFELLVDLVFTTSGWRRVGPVGKAQPTKDFALILPSTNQQALVQVKTKTTSAELAGYVEKMEDGPYERMFYVFHSGEAETADPDVTVIGPEQLAELVVNAGLVDWLVGKVS